MRSDEFKKIEREYGTNFFYEESYSKPHIFQVIDGKLLMRIKHGKYNLKVQKNWVCM